MRDICALCRVSRTVHCGSVGAQRRIDGDALKMLLTDHPATAFALCLPTMWLAAHAGRYLRRRHAAPDEGEISELGVILGAALTLLGLLIGFTFSMAVSRYDLRKNYEEAEANAIGTEYVRAGLLPATDAAKVRALLKSYLDQRVRFYSARDAASLEQIDADTRRLQDELWLAVQAPATMERSAVMALAVAGMNDVLNSQGYTQAAWWNRIPVAAWTLMLALGIGCNVLFGYDSRTSKRGHRHLLVLPLIVSFSFTLIADMESPRGGTIRVQPQNLQSLVSSLRTG
jgi:hypothetical protein